ncbi:hypothetical protein GGTG_04322 [Gaeumannomyces tritici R3-111a-1]|uniref:Uncharacterized protein n=1 Tax=Gaeumannomyces tritici (strain R3-111a-1) TaxID=644352 RepID=J3NSS3_GAET3|nr:hypothetical protein GGTG_04322 [Gaeumannomyces tritici R3-111a-1]EJT79236.1 hypothetical protein GGTG_04322 [Gaeumannomyces tritici R3-111a-1]
MPSSSNTTVDSRVCNCHQCLSARHSILVYGGYTSAVPAGGDDDDDDDVILLRRPAGVYTGQHRASTIMSMGRSGKRAMARMQLAERAQRERAAAAAAAVVVRTAARAPVQSLVIAADATQAECVC